MSTVFFAFFQKILYPEKPYIFVLFGVFTIKFLLAVAEQYILRFFYYIVMIFCVLTVINRSGAHHETQDSTLRQPTHVSYDLIDSISHLIKYPPCIIILCIYDDAQSVAGTFPAGCLGKPLKLGREELNSVRQCNILDILSSIIKPITVSGLKYEYQLLSIASAKPISSGVVTLMLL